MLGANRGFGLDGDLPLHVGHLPGRREVRWRVSIRDCADILVFPKLGIVLTGPSFRAPMGDIHTTACMLAFA